jgi:hypothetical protein
VQKVATFDSQISCTRAGCEGCERKRGGGVKGDGGERLRKRTAVGSGEEEDGGGER